MMCIAGDFYFGMMQLFFVQLFSVFIVWWNYISVFTFKILNVDNAARSFEKQVTAIDIPFEYRVFIADLWNPVFADIVDYDFILLLVKRKLFPVKVNNIPVEAIAGNADIIKQRRIKSRALLQSRFIPRKNMITIANENKFIILPITCLLTVKLFLNY